MSSSIHARLDDDTKVMRDQLKKAEGWSDSEIVRRGIKLLAAVTPSKGKRQFTGAGKYDSGITDLASNKAYLEGLGQ